MKADGHHYQRVDIGSADTDVPNEEIHSILRPIDEHVEMAGGVFPFGRLFTGNISRRAYSIVRSSLSAVVNVLLLVIVIGLLLDRRYGRGLGESETVLEVGSDITGFTPKFRTKMHIFSPNPSYTPENPADVFSDDVRQKWLDLVPTSLYVRVDNAERYGNLPTPLREYEYPVFATSVVHQLHCLRSILEVYAFFRMNGTLESYLESNHAGHGDDPHTAPFHDMHCFEYLRQSIMCSGDTALEGKQTTFPSDQLPGSDGWDSVHVCRDYDQIYEFYEERRADNRSWI